MDWSRAIHKNHQALLDLALALCALMLRHGGDALPGGVRLHILGQLRRAEAATRRLIFVLAGNHARASSAPSKPPRAFAASKSDFAIASKLAPAFTLYDAPGRFAFDGPQKLTRQAPRLDPFAHDYARNPYAAHGFDRGDIIASQNQQLRRRLRALKAALDDLPRQAKRLARAEMRRLQLAPRKRKLSPVRPGLPPGYRQRFFDVADRLLHECHWLAISTHHMTYPLIFRPPRA